MNTEDYYSILMERLDFAGSTRLQHIMEKLITPDQARMVVELPGKGEVRLFRDGTRVGSWHSMEKVVRVTGKGVYRVEVYRKVPFFGWRPWIFSNPIYLR